MSWSLVLLAIASAQPITLDEALVEAAARAPEAAVAEVARVRDIAAARSRPFLQNPDLDVVAWPGEIEGEVAIPVPIAGQPVTLAGLRRAEVEAAEARYRAASVGAVLEVARAYLDLERAEQRAAVAAELRDVALATLEAARALEQSGELGATDADLLESEAVQALAATTAAEQDVVSARVWLEALLGRAPAGTVEAAGWPDLPVPPRDRAPADAPIVEAARREALAARRRATLAAQDRVRTAFVVGWRQDVDGTGPAFGASVEIPLLAPGVETVRAARAEGRLAALRATQAELQQSAAWQAAWRRYELARDTWHALEPNQLRGALEAVARAWRVGEYGFADYSARRRAILAGLEARVEARFALESAKLELWLLAGELPPLPAGRTP